MTVTRKTLWLSACTALVLAGLAFDLDGYPLLDPDEGRNAEVAREMAVTNDYLLPRLNGLPYLDKPVLYFAAAAVAIEVLGPTELAVRLPSLLFTVGTLLLVAWFAARLYAKDAAWIAAIATGAAPFTLAYARTVIFDAALTLFVVLALIGFYLAVEHGAAASSDRVAGHPPRDGPGEPPTQRPDGEGPVRPAATTWVAIAWMAMALGVLTKGPIAVALPLMVALPYAVWRRRARALFDAVALLLFVALVLPWILAVSREIPEFLRYALITETARRLTTAELGRTGPLWYFLAVLPAAALPWSVVVIAGWIERRRRGPTRSREGQDTTAAEDAGFDRRLVFLVLWILVPLLFFTLSQSKRPQYLLPLIPAVGLLVAGLWHDARDRLPGMRPAAIALLGLGLCFLLGRELIANLVPASPAVAQAIPGTAVALGTVAVAAGLIALLAARRWEVALLCLSLPVAAIPFVSRELMDAIGEERSAAPVAEAVARVAGPETQVVGVRAFPLGLPFYLRRTILLSTVDASELTSNYLARHSRKWRNAPGSPLRPPGWWREVLAACQRPRIFVIRTQDAEARDLLEPQLPVVVRTRKYAAYGPCALSNLAAARAAESPVP